MESAPEAPVAGLFWSKVRARSVLATAAVVLGAGIVAGCGSTPSTGKTSNSSSSSATTTTTTTSSSVSVKTATSSLGTILVNAKGLTLYRYSADTKNKSNCTWAGCTTLWPPLYVTGTPKAGAGVTGSKIGVISGANGKQQVTYDGWPLYTYTPDTQAGQTTGQGIKDAHGTWYVVFATPSKNPSPK